MTICCSYNRRTRYTLWLFSAVVSRHAAPAPSRLSESLFHVTDLFYDHPVYVGVESRDQQGGEDDRGEVQEHEVIVVHDVREDAPVVARLAGVPSEERQEAHQSARYPARAYYTWKNRSSFPFLIIVSFDRHRSLHRQWIDAPSRRLHVRSVDSNNNSFARIRSLRIGHSLRLAPASRALFGFHVDEAIFIYMRFVIDSFVIRGKRRSAGK